MRISDWSSYVCSSDLTAHDRADARTHVDQAATSRLGIGACDRREIEIQLARQYTQRGQPLICRQRAGVDVGGDGVGDGQIRRLVTALDRTGPTARSFCCPSHEIGRAPSELQSLMRISYAVFCLKKKNKSHRRTSLDINLNNL